MEVFLAGEFNSWDTGSLLMKKNKEGVWKTSVKLAPAAMNISCLWMASGLKIFLVQNPFPIPLAHKIGSFGLNRHYRSGKVSIPRQSRGLYDCWPLKGA